ncbi:Uncharacterised protein [Mycobacteroides abscessus subsp. bolletii]|nr:Hypothetical protein ERS075506_00225 [Mycobacteroides abscessus]SHT36972.1 Uncharacterised protein [Mycobacteroides abscessus subsp. bolletii]CPS25749.1 Hypothetical protein ERS075505_02282 [Mycobacteroides abscessus]CPS28305.1 Hypothetical protein ERS075504_02389 [Mycobacteroides abscessus]CPT08898.1 Hypothetical protein ERS075524_01763 [Mycobacteroides abscessus]
MTQTRRARIAQVMCAAALITACQHTTTAAAEPPGFPDLNTYAQVSVDSYVQAASRGASAIGFSTAEGVSCSMSHPPHPGGQNQLISCWGPLPGLQDIHAIGSGPCDTGLVSKYGDNTYGISHKKEECKKYPPSSKLLNPGQKISYGDQTCGVGDSGSVACIDRSVGENGFVLQPSGSFSF